MIVKLLLDRKREGKELAPDEIRELVAAYTRDEVPDCQMAAFAMAVCCNGMTTAEMLALTEAMRDSGECLSWDDLPVPSADKHSTGGVGDKLSLVVQPLAAACGLATPSLVGRGLGLTGGTADKMESIPGFVTGLSLAGLRKTVAACGCSLAAQTEEIAPADKRLYALRDVTGTVPSIPLIVSSILSKKLAEGAETLVFDVKCGSGAFMRTRAESVALANALVAGARGAGRKAKALVTAMDEPLGFAVGNALEVQEAIEVLKGLSPAKDVVELSVELAAWMVSLAKEIPVDEARMQCRERLAGGAAWARFSEMVRLQGGDIEAFAGKRRIDAAGSLLGDVQAGAGGYVASIDAGKVAQAAFELGAGRARPAEPVDLAAGVQLLVAHGDKIVAGQPVARLYSYLRPEKADSAARLVKEAFSVSAVPPDPKPLVLEVI